MAALSTSVKEIDIRALCLEEMLALGHRPFGLDLTGHGIESLTEELRRVSLGFGYRFGPPLVLKLEYSWESGRMINGAPRDHENFLGGQIGLKF